MSSGRKRNVVITIVDYDAGNSTSVGRALSRLGLKFVITPDADVVARAERIVFPGVGQARSTMEVLRARGLDEALRQRARAGTPLLGVCVGAQLFLSHSEEGDTPCLDLLPGRVRRFEVEPPLKVPHMGWNRVHVQRRHPVLAGLPEKNELYFVHSYYLQPDPEHQLASSHHGIEFAAAMGRDNLVAVQFHPEKSGPLGLSLLDEFAHWDPHAD